MKQSGMAQRKPCRVHPFRRLHKSVAEGQGEERHFPEVANNLLPAMPCPQIGKEGFLASQKGLEARLAPGSGRSPA